MHPMALSVTGSARRADPRHVALCNSVGLRIMRCPVQAGNAFRMTATSRPRQLVWTFALIIVVFCDQIAED